MRIGVDVDGVLRNLYTKMVEVYKVVYPNEFYRPVEEWKSYILSDNFSIEDEIYDFLFDSEYTEEIYTEARPFYGIDIMRGITDKHSIELITDQKHNLPTFYTLNWLQGLGVPYHGLHFTKQKHLIDCDLYVEDNPKQIHSLVSHGKEVVVIDYLYNRPPDVMGAELSAGYNRYSSFYNFIKHFLKEGDL